jgi:DNA-binding IclR family transcriptional regulator
VKPESSGADERKGTYHVQVIDRAVAILAEIAKAPQDLTGGEISERLHLHKSTVHRLLAVLESNGMVERRPDGSRYGLGWRVFEMGIVAASRLDLLERAKPFVARLVDLTGETAHFGVLRQGEVVSLVNVDSRYTVRTPATVGRRIPLHCTSQGKAILAFLPPETVEGHLAGRTFTQHTRNTIPDRERFLEELALVRKRGYALDNEEFEEGLRCIAAPVRDHTGEVAGAVGIAGPSFRMSGARLSQLSRVVIEVAGALSEALGFRYTNSRMASMEPPMEQSASRSTITSTK